MKKLVSLLLALCVLFSMGTAMAIEDGRMPEMTKASIMFKQGVVRYIEGDSLYDNCYINGYRDLMNIDLEYAVLADGDEYAQKLTMAIASNSLPDILYLPVKEYTQLAKAGKLWDLTATIDEYANEITLKNFASDGGVMLDAAKIDGVQYGIPVGCFRNCPSQFLWIRKDWLDKVGMTAPESFEDVVEIARAFATKDPDGNGQNDTWGLALNKTMAENSAFGTAEGVLNAFGGSLLRQAWVADENGYITYKGVSEGTRKGLEALAAMFAEGLINTEFGVSDSDTIGEAVAAGQCGMFYGTEGVSWNYGRDAMVNFDGCEWIVVNAPKAGGGIASPVCYMTYEYVYAVNKDYAHPEVLLHLINFFNNRINSPEATEETLAEWGVDPVTGINKCAYAYGIVDPYGDKSIGYNATIRQALEGKLDPSELMPEAYRYWAPIQRYIDEGYAANGGYNPDDLTAWQYYMIHSHEGSWTRYAELADNGLITMASYYDDPTETMIRKWSALQALQEETYTKIIAGSEKIEAFDAFVEQWNKLGGEKITEEVNEKFGK